MPPKTMAELVAETITQKSCEDCGMPIVLATTNQKRCKDCYLKIRLGYLKVLQKSWDDNPELRKEKNRRSAMRHYNVKKHDPEFMAKMRERGQRRRDRIKEARLNGRAPKV